MPGELFYQLAMVHGWTRLSFGEFTERLDLGSAGVLAGLAKELLREVPAALAWAGEEPLYCVPSNVERSSVQVAKGGSVRTWTKHRTLSSFRRVFSVGHASLPEITPENVVRFWESERVALIGVEADTYEVRVRVEGLVESLVAEECPSAELLQASRVMIVKWYHGQWVDVYVPPADEERAIAAVHAASVEVGGPVPRRVWDRF